MAAKGWRRAVWTHEGKCKPPPVDVKKAWPRTWWLQQSACNICREYLMVLFRLADVKVQEVHHFRRAKYYKLLLNPKAKHLETDCGLGDGELMISKKGKRKKPRNKDDGRRSSKRSRKEVPTNEDAMRIPTNNDRTYPWG